MKGTIKKKRAKKRVTSESKLAKKKLAPKQAEVKTKVGGKTAGAPKKQVREKSQSVDTVAFAREGLGARAANRGICRDCLTSKLRIQRVWTSCSRKETRSRPRW